MRVTRGCRWNRCRFCGIYPHLGEPEFSIRTTAEVKRDIDLLKELRPRAETAFFGDSDPLQAGVAAFIEIARYLRSAVPVKRLTCYARISTLRRIGSKGIQELAAAGLDRVHIGLESGDDRTLRYHRKGQSAKMVQEAAAWLREAGIEISFYVLLGLGGRDNWQRHILETAKVVNATEPEFLRLRRLWLYGSDTPYSGPENPLLGEIRAGAFNPQTPEGTVLELRLLIENLERLETLLLCDHRNNYVQVAGRLDSDRDEMLAEIESFLALPEKERQAHYRQVGSGI